MTPGSQRFQNALLVWCTPGIAWFHSLLNALFSCFVFQYLAPEVLHKQPYDRTVDWWCLGAVLYEMLYGLPPFYSRNTAEMYDNILNKPLQLKPNITNSARHLLEGLLQKDRTKRLGAKDDFVSDFPSCPGLPGNVLDPTALPESLVSEAISCFSSTDGD